MKKKTFITWFTYRALSTTLYIIREWEYLIVFTPPDIVSQFLFLCIDPHRKLIITTTKAYSSIGSLLAQYFRSARYTILQSVVNTWTTTANCPNGHSSLATPTIYLQRPRPSGRGIHRRGHCAACHPSVVRAPLTGAQKSPLQPAYLWLDV